MSNTDKVHAFNITATRRDVEKAQETLRKYPGVSTAIELQVAQRGHRSAVRASLTVIEGNPEVVPDRDAHIEAFLGTDIRLIHGDRKC
jgi:hypothetical protein